LDAGVVICLERGSDLHMAQLMPLPPTVSCFNKIHIGLPFWYWLTWVVPDKGPLNECVCVPVGHPAANLLLAAAAVDRWMDGHLTITSTVLCAVCEQCQ